MKKIIKKNTDEENKYIERNRFWTEQALGQFGVASNFFFLISIGLFAFLIDKEVLKNFLIIDCKLQFSFPKLFYAIAIFFALLSIILSSLTVLSRLHDLRLTRHKTYVRKKYYHKQGQTLSDEYLDIDNFSFFDKLKYLYTTINRIDYFFKDFELDLPDVINKKFEELRIRNLLLARLSWKTFNSQILTLLISLFLYLISVIL